MRRALSCLALLATLSGCASTGEPQWLISQVAPGLLPFLDRTDARYAALTRAGAPVRSAVPAEGPALELRRAAALPRGSTLWLAPSGSGFTFEGGLLVATRGVGKDLMSSDLSQLRVLLRDGRDGTAERFHSTLDGEGRVVLKSYVCDVTVRNETAREDCAGLNETFVNIYQIVPGVGTVLSSTQRTGKGAWRFGPTDRPGATLLPVKETP